MPKRTNPINVLDPVFNSALFPEVHYGPFAPFDHPKIITNPPPVTLSYRFVRPSVVDFIHVAVEAQNRHAVDVGMGQGFPNHPFRNTTWSSSKSYLEEFDFTSSERQRQFRK